MKRFKFSLQTLLEHRRNLEEKERNEMARLSGLFLKAREKIESLQRRQHQALTELADLHRRGDGMADLALHFAYLERLKMECERARTEAALLEGKVEAQKAVWVEATKRHKLVDALWTRRHHEHAIETEVEEQKQIDETVVMRYPRRVAK